MKLTLILGISIRLALERTGFHPPVLFADKDNNSGHFSGIFFKDEQVDLNVMDPTFRHNLEKTGASVQNGIGECP